MYPDPAISGGAMAAIIVTVIAGMAFWLIAVYLAGREPRPQQRGHSRHPR